MSQTPNQPTGPRINPRGAVDLSTLGKPAAPVGGTAGGTPGAGGYVVELTEQSFQAVLQQSAQVPVIVAFVSGSSPASTQVLGDLEAV